MYSRVDHLYSFFVQWSPDVYGKEAREQGFVVVEKDELNMIDNFFSDPASCSWEVSTVQKAVWWGIFFLLSLLSSSLPCARCAPRSSPLTRPSVGRVSAAVTVTCLWMRCPCSATPATCCRTRTLRRWGRGVLAPAC